jgi:hypothetical protein
LTRGCRPRITAEVEEVVEERCDGERALSVAVIVAEAKEHRAEGRVGFALTTVS